MTGTYKGIKWKSLVSDKECVKSYLKDVKVKDLKKRARLHAYRKSSKYLNNKEL